MGRTIRELTSAVRESVRNESPADALRAGSPMSRALGTQLPVAQGPMTRVSDQADFAAAVASAGALPFVALALSTGEQSRAVLAETRAAVGDRPWGVGVLGFAPEEMRNAQLEAVRELRPTHAIIAGGRPSQAEALERSGIATFLHVPSPGLLRQFLDAAGVRRFVFEGSECGGHVGPRGSFPLWEAQLAVLEDFLAKADPGTAEHVEVFFAGGVHDERSAAMVAALAAPLTARGAAVGVLMGTAYLFTEEAVTRGTVQPLFQEQVVRATRTALLETAPGHATRCIPSPFSDNYLLFEAELREQGVPDRQIWEKLERLNVGRLRIASKGVERDAAGALTSVDEQRQFAEGMFMAGEVAVLRSATTTIDALHRSVTEGAADFLAETSRTRRARLGVEETAEPEAPAPLDIAVIGMACMFPQAPDLPTFWANILGGRDSVDEVPPDRWDPAVHYSADKGGATPSKWGGFLPRIPFDPLRYGIPPTSRQHRTGPAAGPRSRPALPGGRRIRRPGAGVRPRPHLRGVRRRGRQRPVQRDDAARRTALLLRHDPAGRRGAAPHAHRGLLPRHALERHLGPHREPARPRWRQLHRRRGLRVLAGRRRRRLQGTRGRHQRCRAVRGRRPPQRHQ